MAFWLSRSRRRRARAAGFGEVALVAALAVVLSQVYAATPAITDADGRPVPNSITRLEKVNLNGTEQWITIRGRDTRNPVLLNLVWAVPVVADSPPEPNSNHSSSTTPSSAGTSP